MNLKQLLTGTVLTATLFITSCKPSIDLPASSKGSVDFSRYVAIGNSLTAGYADGGLYRDGQLNSYPSMIAGQLKALGGGKFVQPLFIPGQENGSGYLSLTGFTSTGLPVIKPVTTDLAIRGISPITGLPLYTKFIDSINNYGVPGIRVSDLIDPAYGIKNPYLERLETTAEAGLVGYAQKVFQSKPTFFTCWLGNNDALQYALSGGVFPPLTPPAAFQQIYAGFIGQLIQFTKAKGVMGTIPDVTLIPYFNTKTVAKILAQAPAGASLYITTGTGAVRKATSADLIVLTADSIGAVNPKTGPKGFSPYNPLKNKDVLDSAEVSATRSAIASYNISIVQVATANGLALMDINQLLTKISKGNYVVDGIPLTLAYISGGVFSLDGVHLTPRGYSIIANQYINAINATYHTTISTLSPALYRGVKLP